MTDLTSMTIAEAKAGLANKSFTSLELTDAHLAGIEAARSLNAFVLETPDKARAMARAIDARIAKGEGGPLAGIPLGRAHHRVLEDSRQFRAALRIHRDFAALARWRCHARQAQ
jgi:hypothetical protein